MCPLDMTPIRRRGVVAAASNASSPSVTIEALHHHTLSAKHQHIGTNFLFFISSRQLHTGYWRDWSSDVCSSDLPAPQRCLARKPSSLSFAEAAGLPLAGLTAYQALTEALEVGEGDRVLVHRAAGGVGFFAVQIAEIGRAHVLNFSHAHISYAVFCLQKKHDMQNLCS